MGVCKCNVSLGNTGKLNCEPIFSWQEGMLVMPLFANDGTKNRINLSSVLDSTFWEQLINNADSSKRARPIQKLKNTTDERGEPIYVEYDDGSKILIRQGVRTGSHLIPKTSSQFLKVLETFKCEAIGFFAIGHNGELLGNNIEDGFLDLIRIADETWNPGLVKGKPSDIQSILLTYDIHPDEEDSDLGLITPENLPGVNLKSLNGLFNLNPVVSNITTAGFKVKLNTEYGDLKSPITAKGFLLANFSAAETSPTPGAIALSSVSDTGNQGLYDVAFNVAQTSGDIIEVTISKTGYETVKTTVTIP